MRSTVTVALAALALLGAREVAAQTTIGRLAIVCTGEAGYQAHNWWIDDYSQIEWSWLRCGDEPKEINLDVRLHNEPLGRSTLGGVRVDFSFNGQRISSESSRPWRMFGDAGNRNRGRYHWAPRNYRVGATLYIDGNYETHKTWSFTVGPRPSVPPADPESEFSAALRNTLPYIGQDRIRELLRTIGNLHSASAVRRLMIQQLERSCTTC